MRNGISLPIVHSGARVCFWRHRPLGVRFSNARGLTSVEPSCLSEYAMVRWGQVISCVTGYILADIMFLSNGLWVHKYEFDCGYEVE